MARIVNTDNYGSDYPNERFELFTMPMDRAKDICKLINEAAEPNSDRYWKVVDDDYTLAPAFEP